MSLTPEQQAGNAAYIANIDPTTGGQRAPAAPRVDPSTIGTTTTPGVYRDAGGNLQGTDAQGIKSLRDSQTNNANIQATADLARYAQSVTDGINLKYGTKTQSDKDMIGAQDARARVLNSRSGLNDSGTGSAAINAVQEKGSKVLAADDAARTSEIGAALGKVSQLQANQAKAYAAQQANDLKSYNDLRASNQKEATNTLNALSKNGVDWQTLKTKEPDTAATLQKELGLSDLEMTSIMNATSPSKINYTYVTDKNGDTYGYGIDPKTNQITETPKSRIEGLQPGDTLTHTKDGSLLIKTPAGAYKTPAQVKKESQTTQQRNDINNALVWMRSQPDYKEAYESKFMNDPVIQAKIITAYKAAHPAKTSTVKSTGISSPFGKPSTLESDPARTLA